MSNQASVNPEVNEVSNDEDSDYKTLSELGSMGAGHAATALSEILHETILIDLPKFHMVPINAVANFYGKHDTPMSAIYLQITQEYGCDILLMFELTEAKKIAAMMMSASSIEEIDPEMEMSAMQELANILIGSFLSAISDFIQIPIFLTTPQSVVDTFDAIIDSFLIKQAMVSDKAIVFDTKFKRQGEDAKCSLMIFPSPELKNALIDRVKSIFNP
jgi:chemotaxis protein CheC